MRDFATEIMAAGGVPTCTSSIAVKLKYRMPLCLWHEYQGKRRLDELRALARARSADVAVPEDNSAA
jgi:hypothetical protein